MVLMANSKQVILQLIDDRPSSHHYHILVYADQSGEILKMKRLPTGISDYLNKEIDGFYGQTVKIDSKTGNVSVVNKLSDRVKRKSEQLCLLGSHVHFAIE